MVEGSVRRAGKRVRVTAQLVEASTGNHLWAERYDRDLEDMTLETIAQMNDDPIISLPAVAR